MTEGGMVGAASAFVNGSRPPPRPSTRPLDRAAEGVRTPLDPGPLPVRAQQLPRVAYSLLMECWCAKVAMTWPTASGSCNGIW